MRPPWSSNLTTNSNVEMNYWGAEVLGLPECHEPLFDMVAEAAESGKRTAREWYGVAHHNIDLWRKTTPCAGLPSCAARCARSSVDGAGFMDPVSLLSS